MMTDKQEFADAANRLRRYLGGASFEEVYLDFPISPHSQFRADQRLLVMAYLEDHHSDDSEPITREWLASVGFVAVPSDMGPNYHDHMEVKAAGGHAINVWEYNGGPWLFSEADWHEMKTRGEIRLLCQAFGIVLPAGILSEERG